MVEKEVSIIVRAKDLASKVFDKNEEASKRMTKSFRKSATILAGASAGISAGLGFSVKAAADFEKEMNNVRAISGATGEDFEALRDIAKEMGSTTKFTAGEAAEGLQFLSLAGLSAQEQVAALPQVLALASAGNLDLARASDIATDVMTGLGLEVSDLTALTDVMTKTFTSSNTSLDQLGEAFKFIGPISKSLNQDYVEMSASLGLLADAGFKASQGGTAIRQIMLKLLRNAPQTTAVTDALAEAQLELGEEFEEVVGPVGKARKVLEDNNIQVLDSQGNIRDLSAIIGDLAAANLSMSEKVNLFGTRLGQVDVLVAAGEEGIKSYTESLRDSQGVTKEIAEVQMEGLAGAMTELNSAIDGVKIGLGEQLAPAIEVAADALSGLLSGFAAMPEPMQKIVAIGGAVTAGVLALTSAGLFFVSFIPNAVAGLKILSAAFVTLNLSMGVVAAVVLGITAAIAAGILVYKNWDTIIEKLGQAWHGFGEIIEKAVNAIIGVVNKGRDIVNKMIRGYLLPFEMTLRAIGKFIPEAQKMADAIAEGLIPEIQEVDIEFKKFGQTIDKTGKNSETFNETLSRQTDIMNLQAEGRERGVQIIVEEKEATNALVKELEREERARKKAMIAAEEQREREAEEALKAAEIEVQANHEKWNEITRQKMEHRQRMTRLSVEARLNEKRIEDQRIEDEKERLEKIAKEREKAEEERKEQKEKELQEEFDANKRFFDAMRERQEFMKNQRAQDLEDQKQLNHDIEKELAEHFDRQNKLAQQLNNARRTFRNQALGISDSVTDEALREALKKLEEAKKKRDAEDAAAANEQQRNEDAGVIDSGISAPPPIPFDKGGIVPGPPGTPVNATVHAGEMITPVNKSSGRVINVTINNTGNIGLNDFEMEVRRIMKETDERGAFDEFKGLE